MSLPCTVMALGLAAFSANASGNRGSSIDKNEVRSKVRENLQAIKDCYKAVGNRASGKLVLEWEILSSGKVGEVKVVESLGASVDECIANKVKGWTFPKPPNRTTVIVKYPFLFSPPQD